MSLLPHRADLLRTQNFINARWCDAMDGRTLLVEDPATAQPFASVPDSSAADAAAALSAASSALPAWRRTAPRARAAVLKRWHALLLSNQEDLARLISREQGKPLVESRAEVAYAASYVEWFAEEAAHLHGDVIPTPHARRRMTAEWEPVGVVAVITPWNFPAAMIARKLAPALAAGCTVVAKPAEDTPLTALALVRLAEEAGLPAGVINMVVCSRERAHLVVDLWLRDERVRKLSFTGSTAVGQHLARESATTLKRLSLELGGNAPFLVFEDADIGAAVDGLMAAKFRNGGQTCVSPNRIFVHRSVHNDFVNQLLPRVQQLKVAPATDPSAQIGPMINDRAIAKITSHVTDAVANGAQLLLGGHRSGHPAGGHFFDPTVLVQVTSTMACSCEETFGPVAAISVFDTEDQVLEAANATPFGLAAYFYSQDIARCWRVSDALEAGIVGINAGALASEAAPFGGIKASGYGREGSRHGLVDYLQMKFRCQDA
ncbi:NAD-dependent succinate-semialdehyde dehydrogenase [Roseateles sp. SL47]|uniref:NAD-dependent succinate-semialdehyde dehydrogenase n=1 Tax=Roseateles sp. SL47 TaxID=2995138 RepID=UPI002271E566|nr:NAD-dependent succinate-semialdehyde dehydrogenase [Roseateles sp. SL47]WAC71987.1 NAD-dependent succinate-semialdehyde dehydrogenase [Roseateles sp. SL47]